MSVESAHARYRAQLAALAEAAVVHGALDRATDRWGLDAVLWARRSERFEPDEEPFATCLYDGFGDRQRLARVEVFTERPDPREGCVLTRAEPGWLAVSAVSADPALPALNALLAGPGRPTVVRYHPGRRCTVRVEQDGRVRFAKLYAQGLAGRAYADAVALWRAARRDELRFAVARPDHLDEATGAVWQDALAGRPAAADLFAAGDEDLARRIGRAAGSLARSRVRPVRMRDAAGELARAVRRAAELERRVPALAGPLRRLVGALGHGSAGDVAARVRPVHGALHPAQWLVDGSRLGLLDYDTLALGAPELDAATFLAETDTQNRGRVPVDALNAAFLEGFETEAGALDRRLLALYRAHEQLRKAVRVARTLRPDGDEKAGRRLRAALATAGSLNGEGGI